MRARRALPLVVVLASLGCGAVLAERPGAPRAGLASGSPDVGRALIERYGCATCHRIPGTGGADAYVGPPLDAWGRRSYIAGALLNNEENLVRWLTSPQEVRPGTAMPDLGLTEGEARDIAAYLLGRT